MILAKGKIYDSKNQDKILGHLEEEITETLSSKSIDTETVISAVEKLCLKLRNGVFDDIVYSLPVDGIEEYKNLAVRMLSKDNIMLKLKTELGKDYLETYETMPPVGLPRIRITAKPLGVLLHIAAGNMDGLPAFSLAEGLLTGNINILKLPSADNGLSVRIIAELIKSEPSLSDFIYVFDTSSTDIQAIKKLAQLSDGIVVWGGEAAVTAVRQLAPVNTRLIEWGHRLSFAYVSGFTDKEKELSGLAEHIIATKGLLCSSCQVIYIDTDSFDDVITFCNEFFPYLEKAANAHKPASIYSRAELTLRKYTDKIESLISGTVNDPFKGNLCSLVPRKDSDLELSDMFGSVLVKPLPNENIIKFLRRKKGYLQTAGLICTPEKRETLSDKLIKSGVVRITKAATMSSAFPGEAHDGDYPLRRYMRIINIEI